MSAKRDQQITEKTQQAIELMRDGWSLTAAAREVDLSRTTLSSRVHDIDRPELPARGNQPAPSADGLPEDASDPSEIPVFVRDYSDRDHHFIYPIGDLHIGSPQHRGDVLDEWLAYLLREPNVSMLNTGDNTNCALSSSVSDEYGEKLTVRAAREQQAEAFSPLAARGLIDLVIDGNHELRVYRAIGDTPNAQVCDALGINYTMSAAIVRYIVGDVSYDLYLRHGTGGGGKMGAQVNRLADQDSIIDADVYVSGHTHSQAAFVKDVFVPVAHQARFTRKKRLYVCSGSFMGYEDYAAQAGYPPAHIGAPRIRLDGRYKDAHASV